MSDSVLDEFYLNESVTVTKKFHLKILFVVERIMIQLFLS
jgi:hypothetical protein